MRKRNFIAMVGVMLPAAACSTNNSSKAPGILNSAVSTQELKVNVVGTGAGTVTWTDSGENFTCATGTCFEAVPNGDIVTLTAAGSGTNKFAGWLGDCASAGTSPTCKVVLSGSRNVSASFSASGNPPLTVTASGFGTVTSSPSGITCGTGGTSCAADFTAGTPVTLTATPNASQTFLGWSGAGCSGTGTCAVTMSAATAVTANFTGVEFPLDISLGGVGAGGVTDNTGGISCGAIPDGGALCGASYQPLTAVLLTAAPSTGSVFTGWGGACSGSSPTCSLSMTAEQNVNATFDIPATGLLPVSSGYSSLQVTPSTLSVANTAVITVSVRDTANHPFAGQTVTLALSGKGNTVSTPAVTAANGTTTATLISNTPETETITATVGTTVVGTATVTFTGTPGTVMGYAMVSGDTIVDGGTGCRIASNATVSIPSQPGVAPVGVGPDCSFSLSNVTPGSIQVLIQPGTDGGFLPGTAYMPGGNRVASTLASGGTLNLGPIYVSGAPTSAAVVMNCTANAPCHSAEPSDHKSSAHLRSLVNAWPTLDQPVVYPGALNVTAGDQNYAGLSRLINPTLTTPRSPTYNKQWPVDSNDIVVTGVTATNPNYSPNDPCIHAAGVCSETNATGPYADGEVPLYLCNRGAPNHLPAADEYVVKFGGSSTSCNDGALFISPAATCSVNTDCSTAYPAGGLCLSGTCAPEVPMVHIATIYGGAGDSDYFNPAKPVEGMINKPNVEKFAQQYLAPISELRGTTRWSVPASTSCTGVEDAWRADAGSTYYAATDYVGAQALVVPKGGTISVGTTTNDAGVLSATASITGVGTTFLTDLVVGQAMYYMLNGVPTSLGTVLTITSNTVLTLKAAATAVVSGVQYQAPSLAGSRVTSGGYVYVAAVSGTSGTSAPTCQTPGCTSVDGTVTWMGVGPVYDGVTPGYCSTMDRARDRMVLPFKLAQSGDRPANGGYAWISDNATEEKFPGASWTQRTSTYAHDCAGCHATGLKLGYAPAGDAGANAVVAFDYVQQNMGCEHCHGPGSQHRAANGAGNHIVRPDLLTVAGELQICGKCHGYQNAASAQGLGFAYSATTGNNVPVWDNLTTGLAPVTSFFPNWTAANLAADNQAFWNPSQNGGALIGQGHREQTSMLSQAVHTTNSVNQVGCSGCHDSHTARIGALREGSGILTGGSELSFQNGIAVGSEILAIPAVQPTMPQPGPGSYVADNTLCLSCHASHGDFAAASATDVEKSKLGAGVITHALVTTLYNGLSATTMTQTTTVSTTIPGCVGTATVAGGACTSNAMCCSDSCDLVPSDATYGTCLTSTANLVPYPASWSPASTLTAAFVPGTWSPGLTKVTFGVGTAGAMGTMKLGATTATTNAFAFTTSAGTTSSLVQGTSQSTGGSWQFTLPGSQVMITFPQSALSYTLGTATSNNWTCTASGCACSTGATCQGTAPTATYVQLQVNGGTPVDFVGGSLYYSTAPNTVSVTGGSLFLPMTAGYLSGTTLVYNTNGTASRADAYLPSSTSVIASNPIFFSGTDGTAASIAASTANLATAVSNHMQAQASMFLNSVTYNPSQDFPWKAGVTPTYTPQGILSNGPTGRCTSCHMPKTGKSGGYTTGTDVNGNQVILAGDVSSHIFEPILGSASVSLTQSGPTWASADYKQETDSTSKIWDAYGYMPSSCGACHQGARKAALFCPDSDGTFTAGDCVPSTSLTGLH